MTNAALSIAYNNVDGFPVGSAVAHVLVTCKSASGNNDQASQTLAPDATGATFSSLAPDTYTFTAQGMAADGTGFGSPVSATLAVSAPATVSLSLPSSLSATA